jgi:hypothetical protein
VKITGTQYGDAQRTVPDKISTPPAQRFLKLKFTRLKISQSRLMTNA